MFKLFKLIAIREDGSHRLHLENLTTVAEAETALKFAIGQDAIVDGFVLRADEPIPASDGRTYAERVADFHTAMAGFGRDIATTLRERAMAVEDAPTRREMLAVAENIAGEAYAVQ